MTNKVTVVSSSHPEMDRLAAGLCKASVLHAYVRRYAFQDREWERALMRLPLIGQSFSQNCQLRTLPEDLSPERVHEAGIASDFLLAYFQRMGMNFATHRLSEMFQKLRNNAIAKKGALTIGAETCVVGNYSVSERSFRSAKRRGIRTVLNYPNAHHAYCRKFLREEIEREPQFAKTITFETEQLGPTYDRECDLADTILVGSSFVKRTFEQEGLGAKHIEVVPYGCSLTRFYPKADHERRKEFRAIFAGLLTQRKGISYLFNAFKKLRNPGIELVVAGRPVRKCPALDAELTRISYRGILSQSQLADNFRECDVFVFPTLLEGLGLVVLEAMACGLPVITTDRGPGEVVRDGIEGFIVPIRDAEAIAERVNFLKSNPEIKLRMGAAARKRAVEFTWDRYLSKMTSVLLPEDQPSTEKMNLSGVSSPLQGE